MVGDELLPPPRRLFLRGVCWSIAASPRKTTDWIFRKILPEICLWTRKNLLNFGSRPPLHPALGIFFLGGGILQHCEAAGEGRVFYSLAHISWKKRSDLY